jgi:hypothetical protein
MSLPSIKFICASNVFSRLLHFRKKGDSESGHAHIYDHATLISSGSVRYEVLDGQDGNVIASKDVVAPNFVFVEKNKYHRITALENNTVCACIHALRTNDEELVEPDFFIESTNTTGRLSQIIKEKTGKAIMPFSDEHARNLEKVNNVNE